MKTRFRCLFKDNEIGRMAKLLLVFLLNKPENIYSKAYERTKKVQFANSTPIGFLSLNQRNY